MCSYVDIYTFLSDLHNFALLFIFKFFLFRLSFFNYSDMSGSINSSKLHKKRSQRERVERYRKKRFKKGRLNLGSMDQTCSHYRMKFWLSKKNRNSSLFSPKFFMCYAG